MPNKLCYLCKHFWIETECPDYSEYTPGNRWSMECRKGCWEFDTTLDCEEEFRKCLETAETCEYFEVK